MGSFSIDCDNICDESSKEFFIHLKGENFTILKEEILLMNKNEIIIDEKLAEGKGIKDMR